jgi:GTP cyclohydrolase II
MRLANDLKGVLQCEAYNILHPIGEGLRLRQHMDKRAISRSKTKTRERKNSPEQRRASVDSLPGIQLIEVERAAGDARAGVPVIVSAADGAVLALPTENLEERTISLLLEALPGLSPHLLLTPERSEALKLRRYTQTALAVTIKPEIQEFQRLKEIADPAKDLSDPMRGPFSVRREALPMGAGSALKLMKIANLLPGAFAWFLDGRRAQTLARRFKLFIVKHDAIDTYQAQTASILRMVAQANVPLKGAENARVLAFRPPGGSREHLAILIGSPSPDQPPLVRIHSECFTGDLLGSLKCDCGDQLRGAIERMGQDKAGGILLYLAQEGRGIGLINKLRAYDLQDQGYDTVDANTRLGFHADERQFSVASEILKRLGYSKIRLLTNNPGKIAGLAAANVHVVERVPHAFPSNAHNAAYLKVKARKSGHLL